MREFRSWIFLGLGLLLAGLTGLSLYGVAQDLGARQVAAASDTMQVVVAKTDIAARSVITAEMMSRTTYPVGLVPTGAVTNEADAVGQTTLTAIPAGAAVVRAQLVAANGRTGASVSLEKGKVLVAFPTADPLTLAGLVRQGDRVDVLATVTSGTGETARKTQTTLQNLEVLDVLTSGAGNQKTMSLTFVVDHQVALVLKYLRDTQATVDIAVRSRAETDAATTTSVDLAYLLQTYGVKR
ncbi:MAG TPA: Flp pilus assembly protein CpaB [Methylomirabilota bacterium]|jgi:pilus assembly protein CpaB|nr:Flp pilus assembly protein CpaB [Methylomirabilota bacterium]